MIDHDGGMLVTVMKMALYFHSLPHPHPQCIKPSLILSLLGPEIGSCCMLSRLFGTSYVAQGYNALNLW